MMLADGTGVWPRATKNWVHASRSSSAVVGRLPDIRVRLLRPSGDLSLELRLSFAHRRPAFEHGGADITPHSRRALLEPIDEFGRCVATGDALRAPRQRVRRRRAGHEPNTHPADTLEHVTRPPQDARRPRR